MDVDTGSFAISVWVYARNHSNWKHNPVVFKGDNYAYGDPQGWGLCTEGTASPSFMFQRNWKAVVGDGTNSVEVEDPAKMSVYGEDDWVHLAMTLDNSTMNLSLYVNGTIVNSKSTAGIGAITNSKNLAIGAYDDLALYEINATIDEVMIINRSLTDNEIKTIYNSTMSRFQATGKHIINYTISSGDNKVNVSANLSNQNGTIGITYISLFVTHDGGNTSAQNMSDETNATFTIDDTTTELNFTFDYYTGEYLFWSPILQDIMFQTFTESEADTTPPYFTDSPHIESDTSLSIGEDYNATDETTFDCFAVNDTTNFKINCSGWLTNLT